MRTMKIVLPAIILLLIPLESAFSDDRVKRITQALDGNPPPESLVPLLPDLDALLRDEAAATEALPLAEKAFATLLPTAVQSGQWPAVASLLRSTARLRFEQAESEKAGVHLQSLRGLYRAIGEQAGDGAAVQQAMWSNQVALEYLRGGQIQPALELIAESADRPMTFLDPSQMAVAGALNRRLQELSTDKRYELLYAWTMPTAERRSVRVFTSLAPVDAPPDAFARALGERPRAHAFPVPEIGGVHGLFSTSWLLVQAAANSGRLRRLAGELNELRNAKTPHAEHVWLLTQAADKNVASNELRKLFEERLEAAQGALAIPAPAAPNAPARSAKATQSGVLEWAVLASACLEGEGQPSASGNATARQRAEVAQFLFGALLSPNVNPPEYLHALLRRAQAIVTWRQSGGADAALLDDPGLQFWISASDAGRPATAAVRDVWLAHEDHILHLAGGPNHNYLCFRYPLVGDFEFHAESQNGGPEHTFGSLTFGGLSYGIAGNADQLRVWGLDLGPMLTRPLPFVRKETWPVYQRLTLRSSADGTRLLVNGRPIWTDPLPNSTSPWLALRSFGQYLPAFRNFRLEGNPTIPNEVRLSEGNVLRGWLAQFYPSHVPEVVSQTSPPPTSPTSRAAASPANLVLTLGQIFGAPLDGGQPAQQSFDWQLRDGVIYGAKTAVPFTAAMQSRLAYFRPLQNDESIRYEFLYEPGRYVVHPALGRLALLIEPPGVRVHWMTGGDHEWTGLAEDNATIEPLNRRGPRPLPLKAGQWNHVTVSLKANTLTLTLNDTAIYERKTTAGESLPFSFYHDRNRSAVQVRNVVLRGNWPDRLSEQELANLAARRQTAGGGPDRTTRQALGQIFAERHVSDSALAIHRQAMSLSPAERFEMLSRYVLPGPDHETFRLALDFTPTNPAPAAVEQKRAKEDGAQEQTSRVEAGGELVSPVLDLIDVAAQLGRLSEIRERTSAAPQSSDLVRRQRLAILALADLAERDFQSANDRLFQLFALVEQGAHTSFSERWPETLAMYAALRHAETRGVGRELAYYLHLRQARSGPASGNDAWRRHISAWAGLARYLDGGGDRPLDKFGAPPPLQQWTPVSRVSARTYGSGYPRTHWQIAKEGIEAQAGHGADYLYFQSPLSGNYEVEYETPAFGWRDTQVMAAGQWVAVRHDLKSYTHGNFRTLRQQPLSPPFKKPADWIHSRIVVQGGAVRYYANGRLIHERVLEPHADPWLAVRSDDRSDGGARYLRISGTPEVPNVIQLAGTEELEGWSAYYDGHGLGPSTSNANWKQRGNLDEGGGLVGRRDAHLAGSFAESLVRYHRPMLEDGTIDYEFYYRPGLAHCHPALDRLVFLLEPSGVRIHWLTDGQFDRTELPPDNALDERQHRRGPAALPLVEDDWNRLSLSIQGDVVRLSLNGQLVYERPLEATNLRSFGLFHYADQTEAQVRRITWRGGWPPEVPSLADQELAGDSPVQLDAEREKLAAAFEHDFAKDGFPLSKFSVLQGHSSDAFSAQSDGLRVDHRGAQGYRNAMFAPLLEIHGDFDVIATYEKIAMESPFDGSASVSLQATLGNETQAECAVMRRQTNDKVDPDQQFHQTVVVHKEPAGERRGYSKAMPNEAFAGSLRLLRRGKTVHFLVADGDSTQFRLLRSEEIAENHVPTGCLRLFNMTNGPGHMLVVWKMLSIRAQKLSGLALENPREMVAALDRQRATLPHRLTHDFARDRVTPERFYSWGQIAPAAQTGGLRVAGPPTDNWTSAGLTANVPMAGDFDVSFELNVLKMSPPKPSLNSGVYLQIEFAEQDPRQYSLIFVGSPEGAKSVLAQARERLPNGTLNYPALGREFTDQIKRLRVARRGQQLHFLFATDLKSPDKPLARLELPPGLAAPASAKLLVHTGGAGAVTEAEFNRVTIRAE